jgi:hypothetical protein
MANRFYSPNQQFADATGAPYAGGSLAFYASGTSTPLATYSDSALTIANTNPVVLDSAGRAGNIFLQNLAYKVVLSDVNSNVIWTDDPVYSSDFSTRAKLSSGAGSPNGNTAGAAGSPGIGADTYWDTTNNILYVCTTTGTASTAVWTAVNASTAAAVVPPPQGYLTLTSQTPVIPGDVIGSSSVFYTPYVGNLVPIYNGSSFSPTVFSELTLTLTASQTANSIYDVFVFNNSGVTTLVVGPAWTTSTAGSGARGSGAGTTQLTRLNGVWVNAVSMSGKNSSNTYSIQANQGTYLGSIFIDSAAGQVSCYRSYGQSRKWGVWNAYNRQNIIVKAGDSTGSWTPVSTSLHPSNNNTANSITVFSGLPEESYTTSFSQRQTVVNGTAASFNAGNFNAIGWNSTTTSSGQQGSAQFVFTGASSLFELFMTTQSNYTAPPSLGVNVVTALEATAGTIGSGQTFFGTESQMLLSASWRG